MLLLTIGAVIILFFVSFLIFDKDLFAPPTAVALTFLFGCLCCFYNEIKWGLEFSAKSFWLIVAGIVATIIGGMIGVVLSNPSRIRFFSYSYEKTKPQAIYIDSSKTLFVIVIQAVAIVLMFSHIRNLTSYSSWILAVARYKVLTGRLADVNDESLRIPFLTRNLNEFSRLVAIMYAYVIGNNMVASKKIITLNWIPVIMYTILAFMQGGRSNVIRLWLVILITAYTIRKRSVGWRSNRETKKMIRTMAISAVAVGALFAGVREIVGRTVESDPFYYVTFYAGSPIAVLNQVWESPIVKPDIFGQRILYYLNVSTTALFGYPGRYNFYYSYMRSPNGTHIGNAPTAFRPAFVEFGPVGFFVFFVACGAFFTFLYCKCRKKCGNSPIDFRLLIYAFIAYVFLMYFYSTFFDFLSHLFIKYIIELLIIRWALVGWQFKQRERFAIRFRSQR